MFAAGLFLLVRSRGSKRWPVALLNSAIRTIALGLLSSTLLSEPTWSADSAPFVERLVAVAYPVCGGLLFAVLLRLTLDSGLDHRIAALCLLAGSIGTRPVAAALLPALVQAIEARIPGALDRFTQAKALLGH